MSVKATGRLLVLADDVRAAGVPMSHVPSDREYVPVLLYRIALERRAMAARLSALARLEASARELQLVTRVRPTTCDEGMCQ